MADERKKVDQRDEPDNAPLQNTSPYKQSPADTDSAGENEDDDKTNRSFVGREAEQERKRREQAEENQKKENR